MRNTKPVMVRMPPELYDRLSAASDDMMTTPSALARILIKSQLDQWDGELRRVGNHEVFLSDSDLPNVPTRDRRRDKGSSATSGRRNPNTSAKKKKRRK